MRGVEQDAVSILLPKATSRVENVMGSKSEDDQEE